MSKFEKALEAARYIRQREQRQPKVAVILGSGLGGLVEELEQPNAIPYGQIPGFPASNVAGHAARLAFGSIGGRDVVLMQGRFHYYEGLSMSEITFPVCVLRQLGVESLIVTNACGGINGSFAPGDLMLITDHINMSGNNPLIGPNDDRLGPRFPDMTEAYDPALRRLAEDTAAELGISLQKGVYALYTGPSFETAAEIRAFRTLGADAIGMSTVPEVIVARHAGMRVLGISCITNMATGIARTKHSHEEVLAAANASSQRFRLLVRTLLERWE